MLQFNVEILLEGPTNAAFTAADNSLIIPTDTQKNTVYVLAKTTSFDCAEQFAIIVARWVFLRLLLLLPVAYTRWRSVGSALFVNTYPTR